MQCIGFTKNKKRCKNSTHTVFCKKHMWQPLTSLVSLVMAMGFMAGFFQDLIKPLAEDYVKSNAIKKPIAVELKSNRLTVGAWENNTDPTNGRSDVVTILSDRQPVKSIEIYHTAKDQRFKNYPPTSPLADSFIPTTAEYQITDLDGDGVNEIVVTLKNQLYSLHYDKQVNILIYGPTGELLTKTPYPQTIQNLEIRTLNPYSAYKTTAAMKDKISEKIESSTFANDFTLITTGDRKTLRFSWVIDSASYTAPHLHQVEEFEYSEGKLISVGAPKLFVSPFWDDATSGELVRSTQQAAEFLRENNLPDFVDMYKQMKEDSQEQAPELPKEG